MNKRDSKAQEAFNRAVSVARELNPAPQDFLENEFETYELLRKQLPVARSEPMRGVGLTGSGSPAGWVLTRYDDGSEVLKNSEDF